jgi:uncharacterized protein (UPF0548 family)
MDWLLRWQNHDLTPWEKKPFSDGVEAGPRPRDNRDNHERLVGYEEPGPPQADGLAHRLADAIFRFDVFPRWMLTGVMRRQPIERGDTVALRYRFMPGLDLFFAARVIDCFEETTATHWRCGFTYRTVNGHPECGEETFVVEKDLASGAVTVALRSWSRPGCWLAWLMYPIVRVWQLRAGRAALDHLEAIAKNGRADVAPAKNAIGDLGRNLRTSLM